MRTRKAIDICMICIGCIFTLFALFVFFFTGGSDYTIYPREKASLWVCEDPYFTIDYKGEKSECYFMWEDKKYEVFVGIKSDTFTAYLPSDDDVLNEVLLHGTWKYKGENMVVKIKTDNIFDGVYKELVFVPQN